MVSCVRLCTSSGILPVNELKERSSTLSCGDKEGGISPEKLFCWRLTYRSEASERTSEGRSPPSKLERRLRVTSASSRPNVFSGSGPSKPNPGRRSAITRVESEVQVTPGQEVHTDELVFQLSLRAWGTELAKSRSASLSELSSAIIFVTRNR